MKQVILITGASSGIGKACAEYLAAKGYCVYGTSRKALQSEIPHFTFLQMDVTSPASIDAGIQHIIAEQGKIDAVINNAGMGILGALELATEAEIRQQMETNFHGVVNVCSAVLPYMRRQRSGKIINISSVGGVMGLPFQGFYSASKFAVEGYSEALSLELHRFGVKVTLIEPGDFNTGFTANRIISEATLNEADYAETAKRALEIIVKEETNGSSPTRLAKVIEKVIRRKNPPFRVPVGKFEQVLSIYVKRYLPAKWYAAILRSYYKVN
ncbi:SDR family oxidoreductase [Dysgonomonas sp. 25]|uniref:3-ketodihydrosphingosine reductase n=1 Tax=Dysgonomonas sp. 25 TaxID=2302933 RepID=UPI0013D81CE2|nr:SDR family oxidoreductase [Dysgonomonas sp. 25]NDV69590.1 SDR family oxidoreductase [Dysgonomonas sp. 25]